MLSPQTKDQVTDAAVGKLRTALGGSVSLDAVLAADPTVISEAINKVGMWRVKTKSVSCCPIQSKLLNIYRVLQTP